jgi:hypothetical protein
MAHDSDIDLLAITDSSAPVNANQFSQYTFAQLHSLWTQGNPFAWHLALEARLIFAADGDDVLRGLGSPNAYTNWTADRQKFRDLYQAATRALADPRATPVFELSNIFLAIRNLAICYSLATGTNPVFSRRAFRLLGAESLTLDTRACEILEASRILSTRAIGVPASSAEVEYVVSRLPTVDVWICALGEELD